SSRLLCYRRTDDGTFEPAHATTTETQPRGFAIDPSGRWLVACGEQSEYVSVYAIAPDDGALSPHARVPGGRGAHLVAIAHSRATRSLMPAASSSQQDAEESRHY
ncbi:hypothetical protein C3E97_031690, partial [Pseudomonas sp. MWU12-2115]|uniref:beta-propeller fold lactonase family protein n=1 Tax=Pseudomonas sp. MWU12-2115 TaxID=2071713 RepID=UPI000E0176C6